MAIQAPGVGSGLDVNSIVSQLMELEREPLRRLDTKEEEANARISAYGSLTSKLSSFQEAMDKLSSESAFKVFSSESNNEDLFTATVNSDAAAGSYSVNVLALAEKDKVATKAYTDFTTVIGEGTLSLSVGGNSFDVTIDGTNNTIAGLRDSINNAADNTGVTATVVTDDTGVHLVLSSNDTGTENALTITAVDNDGNNSDDSGLSSLAYDVAGGIVHRAAISTAADSVVELDGFTVTSSSNTISGALEGVTVKAKAIGASTISVTRDDEKITTAVEDFAIAYNNLRSEISNQRKGDLEADSTLLTIEQQLASIMNSGDAVSGSKFSYLIEVGLSVNEEGQMNLDKAALTEVLDTEFNSFVNLFSAEGEGIANRLSVLAKGFVDDDGIIDARKAGLKLQLDSIEDQKIQVDARLVSVERRIRRQFSALDVLVSNLSSTGDFLTQQLASMPVVNR